MIFCSVWGFDLFLSLTLNWCCCCCYVAIGINFCSNQILGVCLILLSFRFKWKDSPKLTLILLPMIKDVIAFSLKLSHGFGPIGICTAFSLFRLVCVTQSTKNTTNQQPIRWRKKWTLTLIIRKNEQLIWKKRAIATRERCWCGNRPARREWRANDKRYHNNYAY